MDKIQLINEISDRLSDTGLIAPKVANEIAESIVKYHPTLDERYLPLRLEDMANALLAVKNSFICDPTFYQD